MKTRFGTPPKISLALQIALGMTLGALLGFFLGPQAAPLGEIGKIVIQLIKALATPLLFFAILDTFLKSEIRLKNGMHLIFVAAINSSIALAIGLFLSNFFKWGTLLSELIKTVPLANPSDQTGLAATLSAFIPSNLLPIILVAIFIGIVLKTVGKQFIALERIVETCFSAVQVALGWIIRLIPFAVFGVIAKTTGEHGLKMVPGLLSYLLLVALGLSLQIFFVYQAWIKFYAGMKLKTFWKTSKDALTYVIGSSSSLATLPVTLDTLDRMHVSKRAARMAACIGTNLNNDGIILYEALAVLFVAQAHGITLTLAEQLTAAFSCLIAGIGIAGVPEAGLISLSIVLTAVKLPTEMLPLLLSVDWILSRLRATTNVTADITMAIVLDKMDTKK